MPIQYTNRKNQTYYLHQGTSKTGKPKYFFSMKREGTLADVIPDGFEIYENPNSRVFLRKIQPRIITDEELAIVEQGMKRYSSLQYYQIDVKKNAIIIFEPDQDVDIMSELIQSAPRAKEINPKDLLAQIITYSPMLQFVLVDEQKRRFVTRRFCFFGSVDDWINIGKPDSLPNLVKKYLKHLGKDSYYELY
jgi:hypothetical protein